MSINIVFEIGTDVSSGERGNMGKRRKMEKKKTLSTDTHYLLTTK